MMKSAILSLLTVCPFGAANYINNSNFDIGVQGWSGFISNDKLVSYDEHTNQNIINDQYVVACTEGAGNMMSSNIIWYEMKSAPNDAPLYFTVEFGCNVLYPVKVQIELVERSKSLPSSTSVLLKKTVKIVGSDVWHVISSDYPAYKREKDTGLILNIRKIGEKSAYPTPDGAFCTQLNYAQVGTDPKALGGRGARKKNFSKKDEL